MDPYRNPYENVPQPLFGQQPSSELQNSMSCPPLPLGLGQQQQQQHASGVQPSSGCGYPSSTAPQQYFAQVPQQPSLPLAGAGGASYAQQQPIQSHQYQQQQQQFNPYQCQPTPTQTPVLSDELANLFRAADINHDGKLDQNELRILMEYYKTMQSARNYTGGSGPKPPLAQSTQYQFASPGSNSSSGYGYSSSGSGGSSYSPQPQQYQPTQHMQPQYSSMGMGMGSGGGGGGGYYTQAPQPSAYSGSTGYSGSSTGTGTGYSSTGPAMGSGYSSGSTTATGSGSSSWGSSSSSGSGGSSSSSFSVYDKIIGVLEDQLRSAGVPEMGITAFKMASKNMMSQSNTKSAYT